MIELYFNTDKLVKINGSDGLYNVSVYSDSLRLGDLELSEVGYTNSKMSHLWNAYINNDKLKIFRDTIKVWYGRIHRSCSNPMELSMSANFLPFSSFRILGTIRSTLTIEPMYDLYNFSSALGEQINLPSCPHTSGPD